MMQSRRETRSKQLVVNVEESFYNQFMDLCVKQNISGSTLGRRLMIRHLIDVGVLPEDIALEALL